MELWNQKAEAKFFLEALKFASPEQLFYKTDDDHYFAYWPKGYAGTKNTLQSRNALIGKYTEKWTRDLIQEVVADSGLYAVQSAVCEEVALTRSSPGDIVVSKSKDINQSAAEIKVIIEVKMSVVWNWELQRGNKLTCIGDYTTHQGNPGLLRSDSMLKAIGKSINIRVSGTYADRIPIIILGNTPITDFYFQKVDHLKTAGIIQGFYSLNPNPMDDNCEIVKRTEKQGFYRFDSFTEFKKAINKILNEEIRFFSSMVSRRELGRIIEIANRESTYERKAESFLKLIRI